MLFQVTSLIGCTCMGHDNPYPIDEFSLTRIGKLIATKEIIFEGKIIRIEDEQENRYGGNVKLVFEVNNKYKGTISDTVTVETATSSASCGISYYRDKEWIIFAYLREREYQEDVYETNICTRSVEKSYARSYNRLKRFLDIVSTKKEGRHEFYKDEVNKIDLLIQLEYHSDSLCEKWKLWDDLGNLIEQGEYINSQKHGEWKTVLLNAKYAKEIFYETFEEGKRVSFKLIYRVYSVKTQKLEKEELSIKGQKGKLIREFDEEGQLKSEKIIPYKRND